MLAVVHGEGARLQFGEALADLDVVAGRLFPVMRLHLPVNESRDVLLVVVQDLPHLLFRKVALEVLHRLAREIVEKLGVVVVGDVVEIDQSADHVVLHPRLAETSAAHRHRLA